MTSVRFLVDTKTGSVIKSDSLYDWAERWQMEFNVGKCSIMSVGRAIVSE